jgi:hypothetical protein
VAQRRPWLQWLDHGLRFLAIIADKISGVASEIDSADLEPQR